MSLAAMLRRTMKVLPAAVIRQHGGAHEFNWDATGQEYACDLQPVDTVKRLTLGEYGIKATHTLYFNPMDVSLSETDRIKVGSKTYEVSSLKAPEDQRPGWPTEAFVAEASV